MSGRGAKKRGRPPKAGTYEKNRKFQYHLLKKPKYLQNASNSSLVSTPTASRASSPLGSDVSRSTRKRKSKSLKSKRGSLSSSVSRRGYNPAAADYHESEYHYGSDFGEDDSDKSEAEEDRVSDSSDGSNDGVRSDSDLSVSSYSTTGGTPRKLASNVPRPPSPDPLWLQDRDIPPLELPPSSEDLLLPHNLVLPVVGIYEVLRHFRHLVRLSPFRIEDFSAALSCDEQCTLLIEVHLMLLKALLREEDAQQTHFGPLDHKDSINITLLLLDVMTWPEILRIYVESDKSFDQNVVKIMNSCEYPFTTVENRVEVLQFLCNQFLITNPVRDDLLSESPMHYDDHCRVCHRLGDLLCCETCPAVYHLECVDPPLVNVPSEDWQCALCKIHKTPGVTDCLTDAEKRGLLCRHEHLGYDRHGRKFWFIARRLFVESENGDVWYYTTPQQFQDLFESLDANEMEAPLVRELLEMKQEILRQMEITERLTNQFKGNRKSYIEVENENIIKQRKLREEKSESQLEDKIDGDMTLVNDSDVVNEVTISSEDMAVDDADDKNKLKSPQKKPESGVNQRLTRLRSYQIQSGLFKLGQENTYKGYVNQYATNPLALNKPQRNEERDKKRYMAHKFSVSSTQEFKWVGSLNSTKALLIATLRQTLLQLESHIVIQFMHPNWSILRKPWVQAVQLCQCPRDFSRALCVLQACIKSSVWVQAWHEQLGHVRLLRTTAAEREERKKIDKREKKERDEEEERNRNAYNFVKYSLGLRHQAWKQKGEEYRIHGQWGWLWQSATRKHKKNNFTINKPSLINGPAKYAVRVREGDVVKVLAVEPKTYEYLKNDTADKDVLEKLPPTMRNLKLEIDNEDFDEIDVEKALSSSTRRYYPKIGRKSKLDDFLTRRTYLKLMEEKKIANMLANVKKEENDTKNEDEKNIDVENDDSEADLAMGMHEEAPKKASLSPTLENLRSLYQTLSNLTKHTKCYSSSCNKIEATSIVQGSPVIITCYSPLCIQKGRVINELISLLKNDKNNVPNNTSNKMSILEQCLLGKSPSSAEKAKENILSDLLSAVACAQECDYKNIDGLVKRKSSSDTEIKTEKDVCAEIKSESTLDEYAVPAVGNEMDIDITCNNEEENEVEIGPLKELTDTDQEINVHDNSGDPEKRPPIPKLKITRGKSNASSNGEEKAKGYQCSVKPELKDDKPAYRATVNRRFGLVRPKKDEKGVKEEKAEGGIARVYSAEIPWGKVYLKRVQTSAVDKKKKRTPVKYPLCSTFHTKSKSKTILVLPNHELRKMCRQAGVTPVPGFSHSAKANQTVWPYPCARPMFKTCWLYRTVNLQWLASAALQIRIMWACLRWDDMATKPATSDGKHQLTTDTEIVSLELLKHRHIGQFSERTQYLRRKVVIPLELPKTVREVTSIRSGLRKRKRAESPQNTEPQVSEEWVDEDKLELWEIRQYGERSERVTPVTRTTTGKLPQRATPVPQPDFKDKMEQQLKDQRAAHQHKRALEAAGQDKPKITTTPAQYSAKSSTLTSLLTTTAATPTGTKTVIGTRRIIMTKGADGTTRVISQPATPKTAIEPAKPAPPKEGPQKVQIIRTPDGKITVRGLLPGQQLIQLPDGKLHIVMAGPQGAAGGQLVAASPAKDEPVKVVAPVVKEEKKSIPRLPPPTTPAATPVASTPPQQQIVVQGGRQLVVGGTPMVVQSTRPAAASVPQPRMQQMQTVLVQGQIMRQAEPPAPRPRPSAPQQIVVNNPALVQQIAAGKIQLATVNGQQVLIRPTGNNQAQIVAHIGQSPAPAPVAPPPAPPQPPPPTVIAVSTPTQRINTPQQQLTEDQLIEKRLLVGQPPGTVIKSVTAQVMQTSGGPRIVLQGLQGNNLSPQQLALVQQQVKQQLLKAQESTGKQGMLGPMKMYLAVQPPNVPPPLTPVAQSLATPMPQENNEGVKVKGQLLVNGEDHVAEAASHKEATPSKPEDITGNYTKTDIVNAGPDGKKFVITPDYIQQTIKSALKQENLNPEIEEKLLQQLRYQERQMKPDAPPLILPERETRGVIPRESPSPSPPPRRRAATARHEDDEEWTDASPRKRSRRPLTPPPRVATPPPAAPRPAPVRVVLAPPTPVQPPPTPAEEKRRAASNHSRLQMILSKTKELLKKDIIKKRGLLEKELGIEIQKELSAELALRTRAERSKQEEVRGTKKPGRTSGGHSTPRIANKKGCKKEKLLCICRTPYDNTKFYVGCEHCSNWFHGDCVGVTEAMSKTMEEYVCAECRRAVETQELYCLCRQPYDSSQFYICCDRCQDWFHGRCVGILQSEADNIDEYICPNCQKNSSVNYANMKELTQRDFDNLKRLIKQITLHKNAWPFMEPVDAREAPTYYKVIKEPMDLQQVEQKVNQHAYSTLSEFIGDMTKIFDNCRYFNPKDSEFYRCAEGLEAFFAQRIKQFREKMFETT